MKVTIDSAPDANAVHRMAAIIHAQSEALDYWRRSYDALVASKYPELPVASDSTCKCDFCQTEYPAHLDALASSDIEHLRRYASCMFENWMMADEDRSIAEAKLRGDWPGYERFKEAK